MTQKHPSEEPEEILEDLEDLHDFLHDDDIPELSETVTGETMQPETSDEESEDLPVLQDQIETGQAKHDRAISDRAINQLLDDAWQETADQLLEEARGTIEDNSTLWQPEDTDELNRALKVRIDETVRQWLGDVLKAHIHVLHERIVNELADELKKQIDKKIHAPD